MSEKAQKSNDDRDQKPASPPRKDPPPLNQYGDRLDGPPMSDKQYRGLIDDILNGRY